MQCYIGGSCRDAAYLWAYLRHCSLVAANHRNRKVANLDPEEDWCRWRLLDRAPVGSLPYLFSLVSPR